MNAISLLLSDDLLFTSKITATASAAGLQVRGLRDGAELVRQAEVCQAPCVILDLQHPGLDIAEIVKSLKGVPSRPLIVGYGSHVDTATLRRAREAGCDLVLPRSKFAEDLAAALPRWCAGSP
jgi:DNA-binding NarL/FixJ family response regulator